MKKKLKELSEDKDLPVIKINKVTDIQYSNIEMDVPDDLFKKVVGYGKKEATDEDYFSIAFRNMLVETINALDAEESAKKKPRTRRKKK